MNQPETSFGGELHKLHLFANVQVPAVADMYSDATELLNGTQAAAQNAFPHDDALDKASSEPHPEWEAMRQLLQRVLATNADNLLRVQEAVNNAVTAFTEQDEHAKRELDSIIKTSKGLDGRSYDNPSPPTEPDDVPREPVYPS